MDLIIRIINICNKNSGALKHQPIFLKDSFLITTKIDDLNYSNFNGISFYDFKNDQNKKVFENIPIIRFCSSRYPYSTKLV